MIVSYKNEIREYQFVDSSIINNNKNIFTVIVGKNGTGKSRLLSKLVVDLLFFESERNSFLRQEILFDDNSIGIFKIDYNPKKIIAVSTSPFDKFPINRFRKQFKGYSYLGLRELQSFNFGLSYMSKIIGSLIEALINKPSQINEITRVLEYLGYTDSITVKFQTRITSKFINDFLSSKDLFSNFDEVTKLIRSSFMGFNKSFFENEDGTYSKKKINHLETILKKLGKVSTINGLFSNLIINKWGISDIESQFPEHFNYLIFLLKCGILRLQDVILTKSDSNTPFSIKDASSGEQSVVISILGIASQIEDESLICIDEPEICLHPEWQERYMKILTSTFNIYNRCHFVIATHSPQIVANLDAENSFILSMENGEAMKASDFINKSADYQLATLFDYPGFKNEYLTRIALSIMTKVANSKKFDDEDLKNYLILNDQSKFMDKHDPLRKIISLLDELKCKYA